MASQSGRDASHRLILMILDALAIGIALTLSLQLRPDFQTPTHLTVGAVAIVSYLMIADLFDVYSGGEYGIRFEHSLRIGWAWTVALLLAIVAIFFLKQSHLLSRLSVGIWTFSTPILMVTLRFGLYRLVFRISARPEVRRMAIVGGGPGLSEVSRAAADLGGPAIHLVGIYDEIAPVGSTPIDNSGIRVEGRLSDLVERVQAGDVDLVCVLFSGQTQALDEFLEEISDTTVDVYAVPDLWTHSVLTSRPVALGNVNAFSLFETPVNGVDGLIKRLEDVMLSFVLFLLLLPPMAIIALCVKLTSEGPVIFRQRRYGLAGEEISVWKFRTMHTMDDGADVVQAKRDDPRVTSIGGFLRRWSLDELPQVMNVMRGEMSIVGPRPHAVAHNEFYRNAIPGYMLRHRLKPGITGLAQIRGQRGETDTLEKMEVRVRSDIEYIRNWSLLLDVKIIALTPLAVLRRENAQ